MLEPRDPFSIEAEQGVLGAMMQRPELIDVLSADLQPSHFYHRDHAAIFRAIMAVRTQGAPVDIVTVCRQLDRLPSGVPIIAYCAEIIENTPSVANAGSYAEIVRERAIERALYDFGIEVGEIARGDGELETKVASVQRLALEIDSGTSSAETVTAAEVWADQIEVYQERLDRHCRGETLIGLSTGLADLDKATAGLQQDQLIIVAGRPAMGKTTLAMGFALNAAIREGKQVLVVSLEMSPGQLMDRAVSSVGRIPLDALKNGTAASDYSDEMAKAGDLIQRSGIVFTRRRQASIQKLRALARRHKHRYGLDLLMVDYLQLMEGEGKSRVEDITTITRGLKLLAGELGIPVIALSQLNRALEGRPNKRPMCSDLRESGSIEQDADVILFVYRDEVYNSESPDKGTAEIIIGKGRDIETGTVRAAFLGRFNRFESLTASWVTEHRAPPPEKPKPMARMYRGRRDASDE